MEMNLLDLYGYPANKPFNDEEIKFLKKKISIRNFKVYYGFWKKSYKNLNIFLAIDHFPAQSRKSSVENSMEIIHTRELHPDEYDEIIHNYGRNNRKYQIWFYSNVDQLIKDDLKYGIKTPQSFIEQCETRGYNHTYQMKLEL